MCGFIKHALVTWHRLLRGKVHEECLARSSHRYARASALNFKHAIVYIHGNTEL